MSKMQSLLAPRVQELVDIAQRYDKMLNKSNWKPTRAHIENARNDILSTAKMIDAVLMESALIPPDGWELKAISGPACEAAKRLWLRRNNATHLTIEDDSTGSRYYAWHGEKFIGEIAERDIFTVKNA